MSSSPYAGRPVPPELIEDIPRLVSAYFTEHPDPGVPEQAVSFGTSGHRGTSRAGTFNEAHILAITQAICDYRAAAGIRGPLYLGKDTHALSEAAHRTALEVLAANGVETMVAADNGFTPTPAVSHAILTWNGVGGAAQADGIVITPSHNPASDGGFKYNPPSGGPADDATTVWVQGEANRLLANGNAGVRRLPYSRALRAGTTREHDYIGQYVGDLPAVVDLEAVRGSGLRLGADALGGASLGYWEAIAERHGLSITALNTQPDPTFRFMAVDHDGKVRMDCSSPWAMAGLLRHRDRFDVAWGTDPDADRHGIVTAAGGLMNPNHYLAVAIDYLFRGRDGWPRQAGVGKTVVTSAMIDRVAADLGRALVEVPVGFKWFVEGLLEQSLAFGGEESAGASFLRRNGMVWTTDKDGILLALLAAEITAVTGRDPAEAYRGLEGRFGSPLYRRLDAPATREQKDVLRDLQADRVRATDLAGERVARILTAAPGGGGAIGGLKVVTENGWFAARPSGTEAIYKVYAESFLGEAHLERLLDEAQALVKESFQAAGVA
ncbi:MAG: alpha-D-glucose phosphate-specific phosphoglucomutase [Lentisphaeria bacterium]|nr:alpha-D-glucose phosphate-specific phosphoglucomutase [Lentisphaeria bacterium]